MPERRLAWGVVAGVFDRERPILTCGVETHDQSGLARERGTNVTATLHLVRERSVAMGFWPIAELRRGPFHVLLDGTDVGTVEMHGAIEVPIEPGHHTLQVTHGRSTSSRHVFDAADGAIVEFRCNSSGIWPVYLASLVVPSLALKLAHE